MENGKFSNQAIQQCIKFHQDELGETINEQEAIKFLEHVESIDIVAQEESDFYSDMQQIEILMRTRSN